MFFRFVGRHCNYGPFFALLAIHLTFFSYKKKLLLIPVLCIAVQASQAQTSIKAGTVRVGGNVGYFHQSNDHPYYYGNGSGGLNTTTQHVSGSNFSINPSAGYFVADNLAVGVNLGYTTGRNLVSYDDGFLDGIDQRSKQLVLGAFLQYYRMFTDQLGVAGTLSAGYSHGSSQYNFASANPGNGTSNGFVGALTPSLVFFPVPKFSLGASIGNLSYNHSTGKLDGGLPNTTSSFGANFGLNTLAFSGTYYFGR